MNEAKEEIDTTEFDEDAANTLITEIEEKNSKQQLIVIGVGLGLILLMLT
tara:strand:+ start:151 stop:300 length:150 start_codon:yes stop_codon:yes gene_type:complete